MGTSTTPIPPDPISIHLMEYPLDAVLNYFAPELQPGRGKRIVRFETFVDPVKNLALYKVFIETLPPA